MSAKVKKATKISIYITVGIFFSVLLFCSGVMFGKSAAAKNLIKVKKGEFL